MVENSDTLSSRAYCVILALMCLVGGVVLLSHTSSNIFFLIMNVFLIIFGVFLLYTGIRPDKAQAMKIAKYAGQGDVLILVPITILSMCIGNIMAKVWGKR